MVKNSTPRVSPGRAVHRSLLASVEARALVWMAKRIPSWVNSDHLTALGFVAQIATGICYAFAARDRRMLLAAIVCLAVNWFGDSLDGTWPACASISVRATDFMWITWSTPLER